MGFNGKNLPGWLKINAWREILARIFADTETQPNVTPEWLVNPATNRRLKLDLLYPQIGVAVRFEGLQPKQRRQRLSLEEEAQQHTRDQARVEQCRAHNIELIVIDPGVDRPKESFRAIELALSRAQQQADKPALARSISQMRATATSLARRIQHEEDLKLYADLWEDRQYQLPAASEPTLPAGQPVSFIPGMAVEHTTFGPGVIVATTTSGNDTLLTVDFVETGQKTLVTSLVMDKLFPR